MAGSLSGAVLKGNAFLQLGPLFETSPHGCNLFQPLVQTTKQVKLCGTMHHPSKLSLAYPADSPGTSTNPRPVLLREIALLKVPMRFVSQYRLISGRRAIARLDLDAHGGLLRLLLRLCDLQIGASVPPRGDSGNPRVAGLDCSFGMDRLALVEHLQTTHPDQQLEGS